MEITADPAGSTVESLEKGLQVLGTGAGAALDVAGEVISSGFGLLGDLASAATPDFIEDPVVKGIGDAFKSIVGTDIAQAGIDAAGQGVEAYQAWAAENPRASKNLDALANIALVAVPVKGGKPRGPSVAGRAGDKVAAAAVSQEQKIRSTFVDDLVRPKPTKAVREAEILRTAEGGALSGRVVTPSAAEQAIATTVTGVEGVTAKNTVLQNLTAIQAEIGAEATTLMAALEATPVKIARNTIKADMDGVLTKLASNPLLVGDAAKTGERVVAKARSLLGANPNTPAGVFTARREFDAWVKTQRPKIFDPNTESALSIAVRDTRQTMNDIVATAAPGAQVRDSLSRQSNLFSALDNIGPKAADEASTVIGRLGQRVNKALGIKRSISQNIPQLAGGAALVGGSAVAPVAIAGAAIGIALAIGGTKLILSPAAKRSVASLLSQTDRAIRAATKNGDTTLITALRADRAAVVEILRNNEKGE
jgi:hypothetical protein